GAILVRVSERLRAGGERVVKTVPGAPEQLTALIRFHVDFALTDADVIRVQDRDLASLSEDDRHRVRRLQREYVEVWIAVLRRLHPGRSEQELRVRAHAVFGLINSTPHSVRGVRGAPGEPAVRAILQEMAAAALSA
ncbi:MAG: TetR/AcrR family transcriptional regulator, partial [Microbacterium sp.]|nr:TetR/AcrR family transcriptional regulator [Microbacterium sp.]